MKRFTLFLLLLSVVCWADTAGPGSGTAADDGSASCNAADWATKTNLGASDNAYATCTILSISVSDKLYISSLGFSVPGGSTINGISVTYERKCASTSSCSTDTANGAYVSVTKTAGTPVGTNKGTATTWTSSDVTDTWGNASDKWGTTWTPAEINASGFGMATIVYNSAGVSRLASIDYLAVTVDYTPAAGINMGRRVIISGWNPREKASCWRAGEQWRCAQTRARARG